jgi:TPR repeat protein
MTDAVARTPETKDEKPQDAAANQATMQPAAPADNSIEPQPSKPQPVKTKPERKAPVIDASAEALESQGENYLYGRGVEADCGRAGKSLLAAAAHSSQKAQSVLGTMYATGHCVTRDVPAAYRWFAKALHQDPGNVRLQRDLEVLWQQMTPEEREIAAKTGP